MARANSDKKALREAEKALANAIEREAEIEARYRRAVSETVHDIKNPLTAMMGFIVLLDKQVAGPIGNPAYAEYIKTIDKGAKRLLGLCEALLADYGPNQGMSKTAPAEKRVDAKALVGEIHQMFAAQARERGISLACEIDDKFPDLEADPQEMFRAISNLVSNAVKFTPKGGNINIKAELQPDDDTFIVVVRDSGVGMTQDQVKEILRSHTTTVSPHGDVGTGQGLGVVNRVIRQLGGKLEIYSTENTGTQMKIHLPRRVSLRR